MHHDNKSLLEMTNPWSFNNIFSCCIVILTKEDPLPFLMHQLCNFSGLCTQKSCDYYIIPPISIDSRFHPSSCECDLHPPAPWVLKTVRSRSVVAVVDRVWSREKKAWTRLPLSLFWPPSPTRSSSWSVSEQEQWWSITTSSLMATSRRTGRVMWGHGSINLPARKEEERVGRRSFTKACIRVLCYSVLYRDFASLSSIMFDVWRYLLFVNVDRSFLMYFRVPCVTE